jgi:hypothetical protein
MKINAKYRTVNCKPVVTLEEKVVFIQVIKRIQYVISLTPTEEDAEDGCEMW